MPAVQHIVLLQFKPEISEQRIDEIFQHVAQLQHRIPGILSFAGGPYSSPEGFNKQFTYGFLMTFESVPARDAYLPHPEHERVKAELLTAVDDAIAFDFEIPD